MSEEVRHLISEQLMVSKQSQTLFIEPIKHFKSFESEFFERMFQSLLRGDE